MFDETLHKPVIKIISSVFYITEITPDDIIYAEYAETGAMGFPGSIMIYHLYNEQLYCYYVYYSDSQPAFNMAESLLFFHQKGYKLKDKIENRKIIFTYYDTEAGNHAFIKESKIICEKRIFCIC